MAKYSYSTAIGEKDAAAVGMSLPISTKQAIEICNFIRGKMLERAKVLLDGVINEKVPVPFKRFTDGVGHKKGKVAGGRYPKKACIMILALLNSAQANAQFKGLSGTDLLLRHISAQKAAQAWHYGRRRRKAKRTTVEVVLTEVEAPEMEKKAAKKKPKKEGAAEKGAKEEPKVEEKKESSSKRTVEKPVKEKTEAKPEEKKEAVKEAKEKIVEKGAPKKEEKTVEKKQKTQENPKPEGKNTDTKKETKEEEPEQ